MTTIISEREKSVCRLPKTLTDVLPPVLCFEVESIAKNAPIEEIRIRTGRTAYVTLGGKNIALRCTVSQAEVDDIVLRICDGSLYAHAHTINQGYITLDGGIRVGIVGRAAVEDERVIGVYDVSGLCFRLPHRIRGVGACVSDLLREGGGLGGVLIYSAPGEGKTTLLRCVAAQMSSGIDARRVVVVDTRGELGYSLEGEDLSVDVLSGYPKALGIQIAARSMNAQLIVCDEIGDEAEVRAIIGAQNCGVPLLASAHAASVDGLLKRTGIAALHRACVFGTYVGIERSCIGRDYIYTFTEHKEADRYFKDFRSVDNSC